MKSKKYGKERNQEQNSAILPIISQEIETTSQSVDLSTRVNGDGVKKNIPFRAPVCEFCHRADTFVYCARAPVHYIKCRRCGHTFKHAQ